MKIVIWHGYLLGGTGSNVYTRQLAREWSRGGNDVTVLCQEPHPERYDLGGAAVLRPDVGGLLPTFVLDHYEGYRVELPEDRLAFLECPLSFLRMHCDHATSDRLESRLQPAQTVPTA